MEKGIIKKKWENPDSNQKRARASMPISDRIDFELQMDQRLKCKG